MQTPCLLIHPLGACVSPAWLTQGVMFSWRPASRLTPTVFSPPLLQGSLISEGRDPMETSNLHTFLSIMLGCEYLDPRPSAVRQERFYLTVVWILTKPYTEVDNECCVKNSPRLDQQHSNSPHSLHPNQSVNLLHSTSRVDFFFSSQHEGERPYVHMILIRIRCTCVSKIIWRYQLCMNISTESHYNS